MTVACMECAQANLVAFRNHMIPATQILYSFSYTSLSSLDNNSSNLDSVWSLVPLSELDFLLLQLVRATSSITPPSHQPKNITYHTYLLSDMLLEKPKPKPKKKNIFVMYSLRFGFETRSPDRVDDSNRLKLTLTS